MLILASIWQTILATLFVLVGLLMIGIILLQKNRGAGLSGAFGGVGGHSAFGTKTGDFLTWVTVGFTAALILLAIVGNYAFQPTPSSEMLGIAPGAGAPVLPAIPPSGVPPQPMPGTPQPGPVAPPGGPSAPPVQTPAAPAPSNPAPLPGSADERPPNP